MTGELTAPGAHATSEAEQKSNVTVGPFPVRPGGHKSSVAGLEKLLEDAEYLLDYAAGSGIKLDEGDGQDHRRRRGRGQARQR